MNTKFQLASLASVLGIYTGGQMFAQAGIESAAYEVVRKSGAFEVRDYPKLAVVETRMEEGKDGSDGSFKRLFRYITGGNEETQRIAMTTPVFITGDGGELKMGFVMPASMKAADVPRPSDETVSMREVSAGRFAVMRFSGGRNEKDEAESLERLREWMKQAGLKESGSPIYGYFDPPWIPNALRRNEVMLRIEVKPENLPGKGGGALALVGREVEAF